MNEGRIHPFSVIRSPSFVHVVTTGAGLPSLPRCFPVVLEFGESKSSPHCDSLDSYVLHTV
jgi:hypothetical protein